MAKSAVRELTAHIEAIRQEAYNEGYAAAMRAVVDFSTAGSTKSKATASVATSSKSTTSTTAAPRRQRPAQTKPAPPQTRRGDNARYIAEVPMALPNQTGPAPAIKKALAEKGHDMAYPRFDMDSASYKLVVGHRLRKTSDMEVHHAAALKLSRDSMSDD